MTSIHNTQMPTTRNARELRKLFDSVQPWAHRIHVNGVPTKVESAWGEPLENPEPKFEQLAPCFDVQGKRVLDVGCNDGFYTFKAQELGAAYCLGMDGDEHFLNHATLIKELLAVENVDFEWGSAYDVSEQRLEPFDATLALGLIYHLKHPLLVLENLARITRDWIMVETALRNSDEDLSNREKGRYGPPCLEFLPHETELMMHTSQLEGQEKQANAHYEGAPNWWMPNMEWVMAVLQSCGFSDCRVIFEHINPSDAADGQFGRGAIIGYKSA